MSNGSNTFQSNFIWRALLKKNIVDQNAFELNDIN